MHITRQPPPASTYDLECRHCYAEHRALTHELRFEADQRDGDCRVLVCLSCGKETWFDVLALPHFEVHHAK